MPENPHADIIIPGTRIPDGLEPDFAGFTYSSLQQDFLECNGQSYVERLRKLRGNGFLDVGAAAACIPADLFIRDLGGPDHARLGMGMNDGRWKISFDTSTPEAHKPFMLGHEIGHIALLETAHSKGPAAIRGFVHRYNHDAPFHQRIEGVCEFFAGKLLSWIR